MQIRNLSALKYLDHEMGIEVFQNCSAPGSCAIRGEDACGHGLSRRRLRAKNSCSQVLFELTWKVKRDDQYQVPGTRYPDMPSCSAPWLNPRSAVEMIAAAGMRASSCNTYAVVAYQYLVPGISELGNINTFPMA